MLTALLTVSLYPRGTGTTPAFSRSGTGAAISVTSSLRTREDGSRAVVCVCVCDPSGAVGSRKPVAADSRQAQQPLSVPRDQSEEWSCRVWQGAERLFFKAGSLSFIRHPLCGKG